MPRTCWSVNELQYLEAPGASILAFHNIYPQGKQGGVEVIQHGERVAACGEIRPDVRAGRPKLHSEPGERRVDADAACIEVPLTEPNLGLAYTVRLQAEGESVRLTVDLEKPFDPAAAPGTAFCMELYPPAYFGSTFHLGGTSAVFPREPDRPVTSNPAGRSRATQMARGPRLVLAPEDPARRMAIEGAGCGLELFDGRKCDDEAWFTVSTPLAAGVTARAVEWLITPHRIPGWRRAPVIAVSQVGYHPDQQKRAVIEMDPACEDLGKAELLRVDAEGGTAAALSAPVQVWGKWLRYRYGIFDFTHVREPGVYLVRYGDQSAGPFRIGADVYARGVWQPTLESFLPVQMCHVDVWDGLRLWHAACHLDDAVQAPAPCQHFDGYAQGPTTDTQFAPFEHIPHLNVGGWHDAGDTDLAAGSQAGTTLALALAREEFGADGDQTTVRKDERLVLMFTPDGVPDIVQQVAWGAECLLGGYRASGHSYCGIINGDARRYYQRGEVSTMTDNLVYDPSLAPDERTGERAGRRDDRWAFTNRDTALEYQVAAALAAASRVLAGHEDALARECIETAEAAWQFEQTHEPARHRCAYVPGHPRGQEAMAAVELLIATGKDCYRARLIELAPDTIDNVSRIGWAAARALPLLGDDAFAAGLRKAMEAHSAALAQELAGNPFGVPWHPHIWGVGWQVLHFAMQHYYLARAYPDLFDREAVLAALNYVLGCHPGNNLSLVSAVGARSVTVAFGINRSSWHYTPGGVVSGPNLIRPDFPELREDLPFLWQQSEYVIGGAGTYIFCVLAAQRLLGAG